MKKIFVASVFLGLTSMVQAAFIQCSPIQAAVVVNAIGTAVAFTCSPGTGAGAGGADDNLNGDGYTVEMLRIRVNGTFVENAGPSGQNYSVLFTTSNGSGLTDTSCTAVGSADINNQALGNCLGTAAFTDIADADFVNSFQVVVTGGPGSNPLPFSGSASVYYEVIATQPSEVPEPSTYALVAAGLLGFCSIRRRS